MIKRISTSQSLTGLALVGAVGITGCFGSEPNEAPAPAWQQKFAPIPEEVELSQGSAKPAVKVAPKPAPAPKKKIELAIAHEDQGVDYGEKARDLIDAGQLKAALVALRKHMHTNPATPDALLIMGRVARQVKAYDLAEAALDKGLAEDPGRADVAVELARVHMDAGHKKSAEKAARRAVKIDRDNASAWNQLGRSLMAQSRWEIAEAAYNRAIHLDPVDGLIQNNAGLLYLYMKDGANAVHALERSVELLGDETPYFVFNNLGLAHEMMGQNEEASEAFKEALLLNPFYTRAKVNLDRVEAAIATVSGEVESGAVVEPAAAGAAVSPDDA